MTAALSEDIAQVHAEAAGAMKVVIVRYQDAATIFEAASAGDRFARNLLSLVNAAIRDVEAAPQSAPVLCVACPRALNQTRYCFAVVLPDREDPTKGLAFGICRRCGPGLPAIKSQALAKVQKVYPGSRSIVTSDVAGHV